ncbi:MAG TPA: carbohydrate-binding protein [Tepidisphaeraceae bacterium]|nr:carbohydrate-binding protein [Tepidisphaeraceae bacterium]
MRHFHMRNFHAQAGIDHGPFNRSMRVARKPARLPRAARIEPLESRLLLSGTWFVATTGLDTNPGTLAAPFKTIQHAANEANPGDCVMVRAGIYHESVHVPNSGTSWAPITFEPYNGESVTIDGADAITGWTQTSGSIWTAKLPLDLGAGNNQVFVDGQMVNEARWPSTGLDLSHPTLSHVRWATATASSATIHDAALTQPAGFWDGATIHIGSGQAWVNQTGSVTDSGPGWITISYAANSTYEMPTAGNSYYLTGISGALDSAGEWYRAADGTLSLWTSNGDSPANHFVEAKARKYAFDLSNAAYVRIQGFHIFASTINTGPISTGVAIAGITAQYLSQFTQMPRGWHQPTDSGIVLKGNYDTLRNSVIEFSAGDGVFVSGYGSQITNNLIHDVDYQGGDSAGIRVGAAGDVLDHNTIYNTGRDGILLAGPQARITYNIIHDFGLQTTDVGGIYTCGIDGGNTQIAYNQVYNGVTGGYGGSALFLDNGSSNFIIHHNVTWNANTGLKMNMNEFNVKVYNNTLDATEESIGKNWVQYDWTGSAIENNVFIQPVRLGANATVSNNMTASRSTFVNAALGNYQPKTGSAIVDAGMIITPYTNGYAGARPDAGAYELGQTPFVSGADVTLLPSLPVFTAPVPVIPSPVVAPPIAPPPDVQPPVIQPPVTPPPVVQPPAERGKYNASAGFSALTYDAKQGSAAPSLGGLGYLFNGAWIKYASVDFGVGVTQAQIMLAVSNSYANQKIVLRIDSPTGPTIGTIVTHGTGGWATYAAQSAAIVRTAGIHDLYVCVVGNAVGNIQAIKFAQ